MEPQACLILANRAYVDHAIPPGEDGVSQPTPGGLLAAVRPAIAPWRDGAGTTWIGAGRGEYDRAWTGPDGYELIPTPQGQLRHRRLFFPPRQWDGHYGGVANGFLWPLLHLVRQPLPDLVTYYPRPVAPRPEAWAAYAAVNERFARAVLEEGNAPPSCWIHDYQLALAPGMLRARGYGGRIGFFLHTPFPKLELVRRYLDDDGLARFTDFVRGIAAAHLAGFQTEADATRFMVAAEALLGARRGGRELRLDGRHVRIGSYPVGVDTEDLVSLAETVPASPRMTSVAADGLRVVIGVERADYTKGIPERLRAVAQAYREGARFAYIGIGAPTREGVRSYDALPGAIEAAASEARAAAHAAGLPFSQVREIASWEEVVALQRDADVVFTSSLADGMNLVPLQVAAVQSIRPPDERGVVLSGRDAGVSVAYGDFDSEGLTPVDPLDAGAMVRALEGALLGGPGRIDDRFIAAVRDHDARQWATRFLSDLEETC